MCICVHVCIFTIGICTIVPMELKFCSEVEFHPWSVSANVKTGWPTHPRQGKANGASEGSCSPSGPLAVLLSWGLGCTDIWRHWTSTWVLPNHKVNKYQSVLDHRKHWTEIALKTCWIALGYKGIWCWAAQQGSPCPVIKLASSAGLWIYQRHSFNIQNKVLLIHTGT